MERSRSSKSPGLTISTDNERSPRSASPRSYRPPPPPPSPISSPSASTPRLRTSCSTQRCTSPTPMSAPVLVSSPRSASPCAPAAVPPRSPLDALSPATMEASPCSPSSAAKSASASKPMSMEAYFRLLKKSQVLDQLLSMNSHLHSSEEQLRKLKHEQAKSDSVQQRVFRELERFQKQYVDVQRFFLELVEEMTCLCVKEEQLQLGTGAHEALRHAKQAAEERTLQDLQSATLSIGFKRLSGSKSPESPPPVASHSSLESQALLAVGRARIKQIEQICAEYELQLVKNEAELSQAIHSTFTKECLAKVAVLEAQERQNAAEKAAVLERLELLTTQNDDLKQQLALAQEASAVLQSDKNRLEQQFSSQEHAIQQFALDLKGELKKRYGVVPSVLELRWHQYFPSIGAPT